MHVEELAQFRRHHSRERVRLDLFLLAVNDDLDLAADGHERVADNSGKIVVRVAPGVALDHKLVMRRHAHVDADMVRVLGMLVCRILLDEHAAAGDMIARMLELGDLLLNDRLDLLLHDGALEALAILEGVEGVGIQRFSDSDVVRHALVSRIVRAYTAKGK